MVGMSLTLPTPQTHDVGTWDRSRCNGPRCRLGRRYHPALREVYGVAL